MSKDSGRRTIIKLLTGNWEQLTLRRGQPEDIEMPTLSLMSSPMTVELIHGDTAIRQEDDEGTMVDVFEVTGLHVINQSGSSWHLVVRNGSEAVFEDQFPDARETTIELPSAEYFETWEIGWGCTRIR